MLSSFLLIILLSIAPNFNLAAGGKPKNDDADIHYIEPGFNQGIYNGIIIDKNQETIVTKLSFGGDTFINGIKKELDSSYNQINLADITLIENIDPLFESKQYPQQEFCKVNVTTVNDHVEEMLMPRHLLICGQSSETGIKKAWPLWKLTAIQIEHTR